MKSILSNTGDAIKAFYLSEEISRIRRGKKDYSIIDKINIFYFAFQKLISFLKIEMSLKIFLDITFCIMKKLSAN